MENKTIIHIANYAAPYEGNFIVSLTDLEKTLEKSGNKMIYIFPKSCKKTAWIHSFAEKHNVYFVDEPSKKFYFFMNKKLIRQLREILLKEKPDIVHSHFDGYDEYCVKANEVNAQVIWHEHNTRALVNNRLKRAYQKINFFYQYAIIGKKVNIVALYDDFVPFLRKYGYKKEVFILPNGISENRITFNKKNRGNTINFLTFGGRIEQKGIDLLLECIKRMKANQQLQNINFYITEGQGIREFVNKFYQNDIPTAIKLISQTENVNELYKNVDCFCAPSRHETFSYALAEAMLSGTPAIISNIEGTSWANNQKTVFTFQSENVDDLLKKILDFIDNKDNINDTYLTDSKEYIQNNFTTEVWCKKMVKYYNEIV